MIEAVATAESTDLVAMRLATLVPPAPVHADLYQWSGLPAEAPRLYTTAERPPSARDLEALALRGVTHLYLASTEARAYRDQLRELVKHGDELPPDIHLEMAREAAKADLAEAWHGGNPESIVLQATDFAQTVTGICAPDADTNSILASLLVHDGDTFAHVTNVCTYTVMLARALGVSDEAELSRLGQAALLHDLGKREIETDILRKAGPLTADERSVIYEHPRLGFEQLCHRQDWTRDQLLMIYHHHEKLDGTGYPVGLFGAEIGWTARLCAVVDVFDALTGRRAYRRAVPVVESLEYLEQNIGNHFDAEIARCWTTLVRRSFAQAT